VSTELAGFDEILAEVDEIAKSDLRSWLEALPSPAGEPLLDYCFRGQTQLLTGGLARQVALSTAYDLGCDDVATLTRINAACLSGGIHVLLWDEIVDNRADPDVRPARDFLLCRLLLNKYLCDLIAIRGQKSASEAMRSLAELETETYSLLYREELIHAGELRFLDTQTISERCSSLKPVAREFLRLTNNDALEGDLFHIIELVSFAMCTFDDLADWHEDLRNGRFTYPLQLAAERANLTIQEMQHHAAKVSRTLSCTSLYHELMKQITDSMDVATELARPVSPRLASWIEKMQVSCLSSWRNHVEYLRRLPEPIAR
jgi:hypothetical protein